MFCLKWRSLSRSLALYVSLSFCSSLSFSLSLQKPPPPLPGSYLHFACVILVVVNLFLEKVFRLLFHFRYAVYFYRCWEFQKKESNWISKSFFTMQFNYRCIFKRESINNQQDMSWNIFPIVLPFFFWPE